MREVFDDTAGIEVLEDEFGSARSVRLLLKPYQHDAEDPQELARQYLRDKLCPFDLSQLSLGSLEEPPPHELTDDKPALHQVAVKRVDADLAVVGFAQTMRGVCVWQAGAAVQLGLEPLQVVSAQFTGESVDSVSVGAKDSIDQVRRPDPELVWQLLNLDKMARRLKGRSLRKPEVNGTRLWTYRYISQERVQPSQQPQLPLSRVPATIDEGRWYLVVEVLFTLTIEEWGSLNWTMLLEPETLAVLHLRPLVDYATGLVFPTDPVSLSHSPLTPRTGNEYLNPLRQSVTLLGLNAPPVSGLQTLSGEFVTLADEYEPWIGFPAKPPGRPFNFDARTNEFAATNAYYHLDTLFRLVSEFGMPIHSYFREARFPIPADPRASGELDDIWGGPTAPHTGNSVNAFCVGNRSRTSVGGFGFMLADNALPDIPLGIAADPRVTAHEFGHALLWEHLNWPNFRFAHSPGDALAAILHDPISRPLDRFETFPFTFQSLTPAQRRRHDRSVQTGWGYGGAIARQPFDRDADFAGYQTEQVLSTALFRFYLAIGGDSPEPARRRLASRIVLFLIIRAIGTMTPATSPPDAYGFVDALINADMLVWRSERLAGGAYRKVIRWAFQRQGLFQGLSPSDPFNNLEGNPPNIDVCIDDGRGGDYRFITNHWSNTSIWNRISRGQGDGVHESPQLGRVNYAYVRVKNYGTQTGRDVVVRGFHCKPGIGFVYPTDWEPTTTRQLSTPPIAGQGGEAIVGPFEWTPTESRHECLFFEVSATGDPSNLSTVTDEIAEWRLVPNDNNIGQRNLSPIPGGAGGSGLAQYFQDIRFTVRNCLNIKAIVRLVAVLPPILESRGWNVRFDVEAEGAPFDSGDVREVGVSLVMGDDVASHELGSETQRTLHIYGYADDVLLGGLDFYIDPSLDRL